MNFAIILMPLPINNIVYTSEALCFTEASINDIYGLSIQYLAYKILTIIPNSFWWFLEL